MKIDRLLGVLATLLRREKVTAPFLAEKFEVSRRTISRDIEALCMAGIPIVTEQGRGGGISIAPGYTMDKQLFTQGELQIILSGLQGVGSVSSPVPMAALQEKLPLPADFSSPFAIDLASHYKSSLTEKISLLRGAIEQHNIVKFTYYSPKGESLRRVEPYVVTFQWNDWYLLARCTEKQEFRTFKLSRLWELSQTAETFSPRDIPQEKLNSDAVWKENYRLTALFEPSVKYRLVEEYGPNCFTVQEGGSLLFSCDFTFYETMRSWVLSFGSGVTVLSPQELREDLRRQGEEFLERYGKQDS